MSSTRITADADPTGEPTAREHREPVDLADVGGDDYECDRDAFEQEWLVLPSVIDACYQCPGESRPITRSVHLSRLATHYTACRECEHRHDTGDSYHRATASGVGSTPVTGHASVLSEAMNPLADCQLQTLFQVEGLRGVYLNQIDHRTGIRLGEVVAAVLWERVPPRRVVPRTKLDQRSGETRRPAAAFITRPHGPTVVLGCDSRPSAPDIVTGVAIGLRRMGCHVIDVGRITRPVLDFTVRDIEADGGILVTGAGSPSAWTGADLVGAKGEPWSQPGMLKAIQDRWESAVSRPTRQGGPLVPYAAWRGYLGSQLKHFRNCRRLRVGIAIENPVLDEAFQELSPQLPIFAIPVDSRSLKQLPGDANAPCDLTCLIAADGRQISIWDEQQRFVRTTNWLVRLTEWMLARDQNRRIVVPPGFPVEARGRLRAYGAELVATDGTEEGMFEQLHRTGAPFGADGEGRLWLHENQYLCDGLTTLAVLLEFLSNSDSPSSLWST